jgi:hypothetical protein
MDPQHDFEPRTTSWLAETNESWGAPTAIQSIRRYLDRRSMFGSVVREQFSGGHAAVVVLDRREIRIDAHQPCWHRVNERIRDDFLYPADRRTLSTAAPDAARAQ